MKNKISVISFAPLDLIWQTPDPFLMCVHHLDSFPPANQGMGPQGSFQGHTIGQDFLPTNGDPWRMYHGVNVPGFPRHPHRGFETVTVTCTGLIDHADSLGGAGRYGNGDTQWLTAGSGVQHSEMFPLLNQNRRNKLEFFQIWLNLPAFAKMVEPHFSMLWGEHIPIVKRKDQNGVESSIKIIAGLIEAESSLPPPPNSWAADPQNHVAIWTIDMGVGAELILPSSVSGMSRRLFFYDGDSLLIDGCQIPQNHYIDLLSDMEPLLVAGEGGARLLFLQGRPIGEPISQQGPFVMNSQDELLQAFCDFQSSQFGGWPWPSAEVVHKREKGRFALFPDGRIEEPELVRQI